MRTILNTLFDDQRVQELEGKMISHGAGSQLFEIKLLEMWYLWFANKAGTEAANKALDMFLNSQEIQVFKCLWVLGVKTEKEVDLCENIKLLPIEQMIDSHDKEVFLQIKFSHCYNDDQTYPKAALIYT